MKPLNSRKHTSLTFLKTFNIRFLLNAVNFYYNIGNNSIKVKISFFKNCAALRAASNKTFKVKKTHFFTFLKIFKSVLYSMLWDTLFFYFYNTLVLMASKFKVLFYKNCAALGAALHETFKPKKTYFPHISENF